ncbi:MAG: hypothetical protein A2521_10815 [Deltaproteobacteria bacterium RIFOXYD12_FULL_57_12]|nr:MAG: hypothetical protein A2521_10815 [Deltaproteobacteria bacterium RIFOXYD12_FULL_57_12]
MLAVLFQLEQSQWWPLAKTTGHQFRQLHALLAHAVQTVPYYRDRCRGITPALDSETDSEQWRRIPLLKRPDVQQHEQALASAQIPETHGKTHTLHTSGSTGRPVRVQGTRLTDFFWQVFTLREHLWQRRDFAGRLAAIRFVPDNKAGYPGVAAQSWGPATSVMNGTGPAFLLNSATDISQQAAWLLDKNPDYLLSYPSNLAALATHFLKSGQQLSRLRQVRTMGEVLAADFRALCRQAWNVPVADVYSAQELGSIALQCPEHEENYHVQSENLLVEVLDDANEPCRPGETGRVVVTTLHNYAMPLIRYEVGDYAEVGEACPCGRGLPVLRRILGRVRNLLTMPNGEKQWPYMGIMKFTEIAPVKQFQMIQRSLEHIELRLAVDRPLNNDEEEKLTELVQRALSHPFRITFSYLPEIPRSPSGKFEDFVSEVTTQAVRL